MNTLKNILLLPVRPQILMAFAAAATLFGLSHFRAKYDHLRYAEIEHTDSEPDHVAWRNLTAGEIELSRKIFGDEVDYDAVKIIRYPYHIGDDANVRHFSSIINYSDTAYCPDFSSPDCRLKHRGVFEHEMTHVWQHQNQPSRVTSRIYSYDIDAESDFNTYTVEQQGEIVRDYTLLFLSSAQDCRADVGKMRTAAKPSYVKDAVHKQFPAARSYCFSLNA